MPGAPAGPDRLAARAAIEALARRAEVVDVPSGSGHVRWRRWGQGEPIVLLHGGHGSWMHWVRNIDALAAARAVWAPDMPGYGDSARIDGDTRGADLHQRFIDGVIGSLDRALGPRSVVDLVGFSFGGLVAGQVCAQRGGVRRLVLLGPAGHAGPRRPRAELRQWRGLEGETLDDCMRHNLAAMMLHSPPALDALALEIHTRSSLATHFHSRSVSRTPALIEALQRVSVPTWLVWGEHDVTAQPLVAAEALVQGRAERGHRIVSQAGHWVQYEAADRINGWLQDWLAPIQERQGNT